MFFIFLLLFIFESLLFCNLSIQLLFDFIPLFLLNLSHDLFFISSENATMTFQTMVGSIMTFEWGWFLGLFHGLIGLSHSGIVFRLDSHDALSLYVPDRTILLYSETTSCLLDDRSADLEWIVTTLYVGISHRCLLDLIVHILSTCVALVLLISYLIPDSNLFLQLFLIQLLWCLS